MGSEAVIFLPPGLYFPLSILQLQEPIHFQAPVPVIAVEEFDKGVNRWLTKPGGIQGDFILIRPPIKHFKDELTTVAHLVTLGHYFTVLANALQCGHNIYFI